MGAQRQRGPGTLDGTGPERGVVQLIVPALVRGPLVPEQAVDDLDGLGVDSVVGMALYTGTLRVDEP